MKTFVFWDRPKKDGSWQKKEGEYAYIDLCIESVRVHSPYPVEVVSFRNLADYVKVPDFILELGDISTVSDYIRLALIYNHGGMWVDSDYIVLKDMGFLFDVLEERSGAFLYNGNNYHTNGVMLARKGAEFLGAAIKSVENIIRSKKHVRGCLNYHFMPKFLKRQRIAKLKSTDFSFKHFDVSMFKREDIKVDDFVLPHMNMVHLYNGFLCRTEFRNYSREQFFEGSNLLCKIVQKFCI